MLRAATHPVLLVTILAIAIPLACCQGYDFGVDVSRLTRRQTASPILVGKLPLATNGTIPVRQEIRQMRADKHKWDLFILSMSMFQTADQQDPLSYYQVTGIHGVPFVSWNGVEASSGASQSGYCPHNSVLFPTWHRPYLALYEQQLYTMANAIAALFTNATERRLYQIAASDFRAPYWDWSQSPPPGETHLPDVFWSPIIAQSGPNGIQNIKNPLFSYHFHPLDEDALIWNPLKQWNETKRGPELAVSITSPPSNNSKVNDALLSKLPEIQQRLYVLFSSYHDYNAFSNKAWAPSQGLSMMDSIESIHDMIHIYGGSKGHMTYVPLSAFDPLFFFHHIMTDRLIAIWQMLNPSAWITPMPAGETTFTAIKGTIQTSKTPLTPFYFASDGTFWDSDMSRITEVFGYTYADTDPSRGSEDAIRHSLIDKINKWYGSSSPLGQMAIAQHGGGQPRPLGHAAKAGVQSGAFRPNIQLSAQNPSSARLIKNGGYTEWTANVRVNTEAVDGSYSVYFFLGQPPPNALDWESAQNLAGSVGMFSMKHTNGSQSKISGALPLTSAVMKMVAAGYIADLSPTAVVPFLSETLEFRILGSNEREIEAETVEGLHVVISSADVKIPRAKELPTWGRSKTRLEMWV
ncbi:Tyrosinase [Purpureocillium takamizusanense]|uniref:tyrosinase n=1 Tax=Purpureocillium takamizusanense TaxID=2060973 RepID=A0A9Q8VHK7_9HYPO|nr:Tyrosinase [Purpureocillium takamizusanense]UNI25054.1 Tyrosinase [Purpureocillium takamizusanense]